MNIINWNTGSANLAALGDISPVLEADDQEQLFFRMLGLNTGDSKIYGQFGWTGFFRKTAIHNSDCSQVYYVELNASTNSLAMKDVNRGYYYSYGSLIVAIGFAPKFGGNVPDNLSEISQDNYPVSIRSKSIVQANQDNMFIMSLAIKEAASVLYQVHQKYKI